MDTGDVDLVAVERVLVGLHTETTAAERHYIYSIVSTDNESVTLAASGLGLTFNAVKRGIERAKTAGRRERPR